MTLITIDIENEKDLILFQELANKLKVKTTINSNTENNLEKIEILKKFKGKLANFQGYIPKKNEYYEQ